MQPVIYDVAVSIDGYIAGPESDVTRFPHVGQVVTDYQARLATYRHCLMGRRTYEFGYAYGLEPGQNPYPHLRSIVFSKSLSLPADAQVEVRDDLVDCVRALKETASGPIYLCGGGELAGQLVQAGLIDEFCLKRAPIILGGGTPLFSSGVTPNLTVVDSLVYESGVVFQRLRTG